MTQAPYSSHLIAHIHRQSASEQHRHSRQMAARGRVMQGGHPSLSTSHINEIDWTIYERHGLKCIHAVSPLRSEGMDSTIHKVRSSVGGGEDEHLAHGCDFCPLFQQLQCHRVLSLVPRQMQSRHAPLSDTMRAV